MSNKTSMFTGSFSHPGYLFCQIMGIHKLETIDDCEQLFIRACLFERAIGALRIDSVTKEDSFLTLKECYEWQGLTTDAPAAHYGDFTRKVMTQAYDAAKREMMRQKEALENEEASK